MKILSLLSIVTLLLTIVSSASIMKDHKWKHRVIIVFTEADLSKEWKKAQAELDDRHLIYYQINANNQVTTNNNKPLTTDQVKAIRDNYSKLANKEETQVILIGKDGGVKKRDTQLNLKSLFALIDTMPMRQQEMKESRK